MVKLCTAWPISPSSVNACHLPNNPLRLPFQSKLPKPSKLSVLLTSIRRLLPKHDDVTILDSSSLSHVLTLTETELLPDVNDAALLATTPLTGISLVDLHGPGGDVLIPARRNLVCSLIDVPSSSEMLRVHIKAFNSHLRVGVQ